ncbi:MAG: TonB-dependent receptor plug domain-containing protein, partial [Planctomycetota bacterium]
MYPRCLSLSLLAVAVGAVETGTDTPTIIITADRHESTLERSAVSVAVVTRDDLHDRGSPTETVDWFREQPGIGVFARYGGFDGGVPEVHIRGLDSTYTQVVIDGIPLSNPTSIGNDLSFGFLSPAGLQRMEILKGPQSGLYGSRAVGGVAGMQTIRPTAHAEQQASVTGGSFGTMAASVQATGPITKDVGFAIAVEGLHSDGFSATTPDPEGNPKGYEADSLDRLSYNARLEWRPSRETLFYAAAMGGTVEQQFDDFYYDSFTFATLLDETANDTVGKNTAFSNRFAVGAGHTDDTRDWAVDLARTTITTHNFTIAGPTYFGGPVPDPATIAYRGDDVFTSARFGIKPIAGLRIGGGVDGTWRHGSQDRSDLGLLWDDRERSTGAWVQADWSATNVETSAVTRIDNLSGFGNHVSGRLAGAVMTTDQTAKFHASLGNGYRGPSLYERFGSERGGFTYQGNPDLEAETFIGYEAGVDVRPAQ